MLSKGIIKQLPDAIANQIAAGEVIQRPASVVKELLENAIDAQSTQIQLIVKDAGKTLIQVVDNGKGMSPTDARLCFERHATSKISQVNDLFQLVTMGFRGEALASIAAIAQVTLKTRTAEDELGTMVQIEGSKALKQEVCQTAEGTSLEVKNLFFNVPARRQFLKSDTVELRHIYETFEQIALAHPEINFILFNNDAETYHLKSGNLKQRIIALFGAAYDERLLPIEEETDFLRIDGFVGKPKFAKKSKSEQFFFVNNRYIKSTYLHQAVISAYDTLLNKDNLPFYVINIQIDPTKIDVNIHPTKQEIKFDDERVVYTFINAAIKHALSAFNITPALDFDQELSLQYQEKEPTTPLPTFTQKFDNTPSGGTRSKENDWKEAFKTQTSSSKNFAVVPSSLSQSDTIETDSQEPADQGSLFGNKTALQAMQIHLQYILYPIKSGFILVDQQAAHERILFEKFEARNEKKTFPTQKLLFPITLKMGVNDSLLLQNILPDINALGYELSHFGGTDFVLYGVPTDIAQGNEQQVFEDLVQQFKNNTQDLNLDKRSLIAKVMARHSCIKHGTSLSLEEMTNLIDQLFACKLPYVAPNGSATFIKYSLAEVEKEFKKK
ncbi:MAG: DNA mismatch repair endonuclease MutL [Chitinophagales bacterium]|nr:DNA mismatch repair endonuclease MutL [Bacteroidota bacterium]MCB9042614.1 DNA mismatch repair endonuclease MutL [Chitinophagales bacterium]